MSPSPELKTESHLERVLKAGHFAVTAELGPPRSADPEVIRRKAGILRGYVDAANLTDGQGAVVRMGPLASSYLTLQCGVEPVMQMGCRDRNRIAQQADVLGAAALGIRNILCITGDHPRFGTHPHAKPVFDMDSIHLVRVIRNMRDHGVLLSGEPLKVPPRVFIGAVENPFAEPFEFRVVRLAKKVQAGAEFIQTQLIFNVEKFRRWMRLVVDAGLHEKVYILAGVGPIRSLRAAEFMRDHVPGVEVPEELVRRMRDAADQREEGYRIGLEIMQQVREIPGVAGLHIMPMDWEEAVQRYVTDLGLYPRPSMAEPTGATASTPSS
jgi:5,10-methylenetetrahydrofolate reductase